jgi:hypothetical protein
MAQERETANYKELTGAFATLLDKLLALDGGSSHDTPADSAPRYGGGEARQRLAEQLAQQLTPPGDS